MLKENTVIGLGSVARAGKNTFFNLFHKQFPNSEEFSLAYELRLELYDYFLQQFNVDVFNLSGTQKEKFRPFLVHHAKIRREESNNTYFTKILEPKIREYHKVNPSGIAIITDIRHNSDCDWLKKDMNGILVHIQRYNLNLMRDFNGNPFPNIGDKNIVQPANEAEAKDDPYLIQNANYRVIWKTSVDNFSDLDIYVEEFIKYLNR
jgi:hypothetical protein